MSRAAQPHVYISLGARASRSMQSCSGAHAWPGDTCISVINPCFARSRVGGCSLTRLSARRYTVCLPPASLVVPVRTALNSRSEQTRFGIVSVVDRSPQEHSAASQPLVQFTQPQTPASPEWCSALHGHRPSSCLMPTRLVSDRTIQAAGRIAEPAGAQTVTCAYLDRYHRPRSEALALSHPKPIERAGSEVALLRYWAAQTRSSTAQCQAERCPAAQSRSSTERFQVAREALSQGGSPTSRRRFPAFPGEGASSPARLPPARAVFSRWPSSPLF